MQNLSSPTAERGYGGERPSQRTEEKRREEKRVRARARLGLASVLNPFIPGEFLSPD